MKWCIVYGKPNAQKLDIPDFSVEKKTGLSTDKTGLSTDNPDLPTQNPDFQR